VGFHKKLTSLKVASIEGGKMKIGVLSDTHGNIPYLEKAIDLLRQEEVDKIIHLGDDYEDIDFALELDLPIIRVPGVYSGYYKDKSIPHRRVGELVGWKVLLTHSPTPHENDLPADLAPEDMVRSEVIETVLYGHTHIPKIEEKDGVVWFNPGHLRIEDKKGYPASWGIIDFQPDRIQCKIVVLQNGKNLFAERYPKKG